MSYLSTAKTLILVSFISLLLGGCSGGSGGVDSDHGLVPTPTAETNVTDTNTSAGGSGGGTDTHTAPDTNGTIDANGTAGGNDDNGSLGGNDTNGTLGNNDNNGTTIGGDDNGSLGGGDINGTVGGNDDNGTTGGGDTNGTAGGGSDDGNTTGGGNDTNTTTPTVRLSALKLTAAETTLNKDHNTTVTLTATYSDHTTKPLTSGITWIITPSDAVTLHGTTLTALKDVNVTVQAKVGTTLSNTVNLNIYWEVNGHRLPPEPDPKVNDATLGGVDSNNNGVRDDVERKIYEKYPVKLHQALLMDVAKFYQMAMSKPIEKAHEVEKYSTEVGNCALHLKHIKQRPENWRDAKLQLKYISINTKERVRKYLDYNIALSGGVYGSSPADWNRDACSQEVRKVLEEMGK